MGTVFVKLKNKAFIIRLLKSIMLGIFVSALAGGVLIMLSKLEIWEQSLYIQASIVGGAFIVVAIATYFSLRISKERLAKELDKRYNLDEKVQTMLVFKEESGALVELQRQDADKALAGVRKVKIGIKTIWIYILCMLLGLGDLYIAIALTIFTIGYSFTLYRF